jgi:hypothetical protein
MVAIRWALLPVLLAETVMFSPCAIAEERGTERAAAAKLAIEKGATDRARTVQWAQKLGIWCRWYTPGSDDPAQTREAARELILAIDDPLAIPALLERVKKEKYGMLRLDLPGPFSTAPPATPRIRLRFARCRTPAED